MTDSHSPFPADNEDVETNDQQVILYVDRDARQQVYSTAYSRGQAETAERACFARHGENCNARPVLAEDHPPKERGA